MRFSNCLNPQRVFNPYIGEFIHVPCGHCDACLNIRAYNWEIRLQQEAQLHKYCVFFTLTYDNDCLPCFVKLDNETLVSKPRLFRYYNNQGVLCSRIFHDGLFINVKDIDLSEDKDRLYFEKYNNFSYPSVDDIQRFVKRVRYYINELFKNNSSKEAKAGNGTGKKIRYYIISEAGSINHRYHYHGLFFFDSSAIAKEIESIIHKSWLLCDSKRIDVQFATCTAIQYVTKYLNCVAHLPSVYRLDDTRPFALFSRRPFIGHDTVSKSEIRQIISESKVCVPFFDNKAKKVVITRINNSFERRYFPRIYGYSVFTDSVRITLYRLVSQTGQFDWNQFYQTVWIKHNCNGWITIALSEVFNRVLQYCERMHIINEVDKRFEETLHRIFLVSRNVYYRASEFNFTVDYYIKCIENYYNEVDKYNLNKMYVFMSEYVVGNPKIHHDPLDLELMFPNKCVDYHERLKECEDFKCMDSLHSKIARDMRTNKERKAYNRAKKLHTTIREY